MVRTQIQLTEEQAAKLKRIAGKKQQSMAEVIRQAIDNFVSSANYMNREDRRKKALAAAGRFRSGVHDLSEQHDKHLVDALKR
jgi:predicted transcriptional regulator